MPRFSFRLAICVVAAATALACREPRSAGRGGVHDDFGVAIDTAAPPAQRIVSLNPATTELLFALGAGSAVVGRSDWDQWPVEARSVPKTGPGLRPNVEAVLARTPDLVVLYASEDNRGAADRLRAAGVTVIALRTDSIAHFERAAQVLGARTGRRAQADSLVASIGHTLDSVRAATAGAERPRVFWYIWDAPLITIGAGSYMHELLVIAGGENLYGDLPAVSPQVSMEDVIRRDPDVILTGPVNAAHITSDPRWQSVRAVREGRIAVVDTNLVGRPSVSLGAAAVHLAKLLHGTERNR